MHLWSSQESGPQPRQRTIFSRNLFSLITKYINKRALVDWIWLIYWLQVTLRNTCIHKFLSTSLSTVHRIEPGLGLNPSPHEPVSFQGSRIRRPSKFSRSSKTPWTTSRKTGSRTFSIQVGSFKQRLAFLWRPVFCGYWEGREQIRFIAIKADEAFDVNNLIAASFVISL